MITAKTLEQYADKYDTRIITIIILWYFWSGCTLYLNKYLVDFQDADSALLSNIKLLSVGLKF